jgi:hypothetical protein
VHVELLLVGALSGFSFSRTASAHRQAGPADTDKFHQISAVRLHNGKSYPKLAGETNVSVSKRTSDFILIRLMEIISTSRSTFSEKRGLLSEDYGNRIVSVFFLPEFVLELAIISSGSGR